MASLPLTDDALMDTSGFADSTPEPAKESPKTDEGVGGEIEGDDTLELTDEQALDDSAAASEGEEKTENPVEKRIKGALKSRDEARNQLEQVKSDKAELERRLAAIEAKMSPANDGVDTEAASAAPDPSTYEFGALDENYLNDLTEYKAELKVNEALQKIEQRFQEQQEQKSQQQQAEAAMNAAKDIVAKGVALYDDFEEVVWERGMREEYKLDKPTFDAIQEATHQAEIAYALASDPAEAERVFNMTPAQQAKYVFQKDQELSGNKTARVTKAPVPPGQTVRGASGRFTVAPDTDDLDAFATEFFKK